MILNSREVKKIENTDTRSATERLEELDRQRKSLKVQESKEKAEAKEQKKIDLKIANKILIERAEDLKKIQKEIYTYNRLPKAKKLECEIRDNIVNLCGDYVLEASILPNDIADELEKEQPALNMSS